MSIRLLLPYAAPRYPQWDQVGELIDCTDKPYRYYEAVLDAWMSRDDLVILEHDIRIGMWELSALVRTGELATIPYPLHPQRTLRADGRIWSVFAHGSPLSPPSDRAERSGLGCVFIPAETECRQYVPLEAHIHWEHVCTWIADHILKWEPNPLPWRILWLPITHLDPLPGAGPEMDDDPRWITVTT